MSQENAPSSFQSLKQSQPGFIDAVESGAMGDLIDAHGRRITDLRISVTDRCNLRCSYCVPDQGLVFAKRERLLHRGNCTTGRDRREPRHP